MKYSICLPTFLLSVFLFNSGLAEITIDGDVIYIDKKYSIVLDKNNPDTAIVLNNLEKNRSVITIKSSGVTPIFGKECEFPLVFSFSQNKWEVFDRPISRNHPSGYPAVFYSTHLTSSDGKMSVGGNGHLGADKISGVDIVSIDKDFRIEVLSAK